MKSDQSMFKIVSRQNCKAAAGAAAVAMLTVSWQSWKAANKSPVEALRYE